MNMKSINALILALVFLMLLCVTPDSLDASGRKTPRKPGEPRELSRQEQARIEGYMNYFSHALFRFCSIYGEYPSSPRQLVKSGLIVVWPINPLTNKPVRFIRKIREGDYKYAGEMCYVFDSTKSGYFKGIFETTRSMGWEFYEFPETIDQSKLDELRASDSDSYSEKEPYRFAKSIVSIFGAFKNIHLDKRNGRLPQTIEELFGRDFRILSEYYRPKYTGDDSKEGGFFELGVDLAGQVAARGGVAKGFDGGMLGRGDEVHASAAPLRCQLAQQVHDDRVAHRFLEFVEHHDQATGPVFSGVATSHHPTDPA